ncbi:PepSY-associated TM helix domain-containing protein [Chitinivorax sp. B]|uniref:PepSY-associated TM helix domain-containing protein n=1 Tax=Chitinivorax sp. B TaxID=2502235 RepID=UPI0010F5457D|nr:PepSY-associated TM helix domain-containing protein [Chitinivorax sp. B]
MKRTFTQTMAWLHTWCGLLIGWLLFVIFVGGTLACFDKELNHWMRPAAHGAASTQVNYDQAAAQLHRIMPNAHAWYINPPNEREPTTSIGWFNEGETFQRRALSPVDGQLLPDTAGGNFFFELHYNLHAGTIGLYIVGIAGMMMLVALVTGIIIHKRIFKDFFTFRPQASRQRSWLDAHNVTAVLGLPFHLLIAYTGLMIFVVYYMQAGVHVAYQGDSTRFFNEVSQGFEREEQHQPLPKLASLDRMVAAAQQHWQQSDILWVGIHHPNDTSATVEVRARRPQHVAWSETSLYYDGVTGQLLKEKPELDTAYHVYTFMGGLHMAQFGGAMVRWLYLLMGAAGCVMIASGLTVWLEKRSKRTVQSTGFKLVRALNIGVVGGMLVAVAAYFWGNRLLPAGLANRNGLEMQVFFVSWLVAATWGLIRARQGQPWSELLGLAAILLLGLPVLNGLTTTHSHLLVTIPQGIWSLALVDLTMLLTGMLLALLAWRLRTARQHTAAPLAQPVHA